MVTTSELKEMMETITNSTVKSAVNSAVSDVKAFTDTNPVYTNAVNIDNISLTKSTPGNGVFTFTFKGSYGITITVSYRS